MGHCSSSVDQSEPTQEKQLLKIAVNEWLFIPFSLKPACNFEYYACHLFLNLPKDNFQSTPVSCFASLEVRIGYLVSN